jgi:hypothetical protein
MLILCSDRREAVVAAAADVAAAVKIMIETAIASKHPVLLLTQHLQLQPQQEAKIPMPSVSFALSLAYNEPLTNNDRWRLPKLPLPLVSILNVSAAARRRSASRWSPGTGSLVMPSMSLSGGDRTLAFMGDLDRALVHNAVGRVPSSMPDLIDVA